MLWLAAILYGLWITPLRLGVDLRVGETLPWAAWGVLVWGVPIRGQVGLQRDGTGALQLASVPRRKRSFRPASDTHILRRFAAAIGRPGPGRRLLRRGTCLARLDVMVQAGGDAARAALLTGLIQAAAGCLPRVRLRCRTVYGGAGALRARCIVDVRLGILWTAALMGWLNRPRAGWKEET